MEYQWNTNEILTVDTKAQPVNGTGKDDLRVKRNADRKRDENAADGY